DRHHLAVAPLHAARIAQVAPAAVTAQHDLPAPATPAIAAQPRPNAIRFGADAVGQAQAPIRQSDQARRVAFAQVGHRRLLVLPRLAVVLRTVGVEPALRPLAAADRREQFGSAQADGGRHDGVAPGLVTDPGDELPAPAAVTGANAQGTALAAVRL